MLSNIAEVFRFWRGLGDVLGRNCRNCRIVGGFGSYVETRGGVAVRLLQALRARYKSLIGFLIGEESVLCGAKVSVALAIAAMGSISSCHAPG
jgi:hypothetical protein